MRVDTFSMNCQLEAYVGAATLIKDDQGNEFIVIAPTKGLLKQASRKITPNTIISDDKIIKAAAFNAG